MRLQNYFFPDTEYKVWSRRRFIANSATAHFTEPGKAVTGDWLS